MRNQWIKWSLILVLLVAFQCIDIPSLMAQCPMCRMSAESNLSNGGSAGKGLNTGILYMLATPYLLVGVLGFIWWRNKKAAELETQESEQ